jgi:hypothetical protein
LRFGTFDRLCWALALATLAAGLAPVRADEPKWIRSGLEWSIEQPPVQNVDQARLEKQKAGGCGGSLIRFGDTAVMRGWSPGSDWSEEVRKLSSSAAFVDTPELAYDLLGKALDHADLDAGQRAVLENQMILTALQFDNRAEAQRLLAQYGTPAALPGPILSDRLLWQILASGPSASPESWRSERLPRLDAAMAADPTSFPVRVWRVIGWLEAEPWTHAACGPAIKAFSDRLLDVSDAGACPLMISHFARTSDLHFGPDGPTDGATVQAAWRRFASALFAIIVEDSATAEALRVSLVEASKTTVCARQMSGELEILERKE